MTMSSGFAGPDSLLLARAWLRVNFSVDSFVMRAVSPGRKDDLPIGPDEEHHRYRNEDAAILRRPHEAASPTGRVGLPSPSHLR